MANDPTQVNDPHTFLDAVILAGTVTASGRPLDAGSPHATASYRKLLEDFEGIAGGTKPPHLTTDVHATGTADYVTGGLGQFRLGLTAADAAEAAQVLGHEVDITKGPILTVRARLDGLNLDATGGEQFVIGLSSAHANAEDSLDSVATSAWFLVVGGDPEILYESDDNSGDGNDDDNASGVDLVDDTWTTFTIDARDLAAVAFSVDGVQVGTTNMEDATGVVRFLACIQRPNDTGTETIRHLELDYYELITTR